METSNSNDPSVLRPQRRTSTASGSNFWKLWGANSFSNLGDGLYQVAIPLLATQLTRSPAWVAGASVMLNLPWMVFALQAGSIVDRFDRRAVMLAVTSGRLVILLGLTLAVTAGSASLPLLYLAAFLLGIGETLMDTSLVSIVPSLVSQDRLNWANARITAAQTVTNTFIGPPLAGFLAGLGQAFATGISTFLYAAAGLMLIIMRGSFAIPDRETSGASLSMWQHLTGGLRFLWNNSLIRSLTLFTASMNLFWSGWGALLVLYAVRPGPMGLNEFEYGLLLTAMAVGGLAGAMLCERIAKTIGTRNALVLDLAGTILLVGIPALTSNAIAVGLSAFLAGFGASIWVILISSIRQRVVSNDLLGRVYSASRFISWGVGPLGAGLAALVAELWGIRVMFAIGAAISTGLLLLFLKHYRSDAFINLEEATPSN